MAEKRRRFMTGLAAVSLAGVIALAAWAMFGPKQSADFPADAPYVPAEYVYVTPSGSKYHRAECSSIADSKNVECITPEEALERGYEACLTCEP